MSRMVLPAKRCFDFRNSRFATDSDNLASRFTNGRDLIDSLVPPHLAKVLVEKGRHPFMKVNPSFFGLKDMSVVIENDVFRRQAVLLQRGDHSFRLIDRDAHILATV